MYVRQIEKALESFAVLFNRVTFACHLSLIMISFKIDPLTLMNKPTKM